MRKFFFAVAACVVLLFPTSSRALLVLRLNIEQLANLADRIFVGQCISIKEGRDRNDHYVTYVTYRVDQVLKGDVGARLTFKQITAPPASESSVPGNPDLVVTSAFRYMPKFQLGSNDVVFLSGDSEIGLAAPIGLQQGLFHVRDVSGEKLVVNDTGNHGLFQGLKKSKNLKNLALSADESELMGQDGTELSYSPFLSLVKKLVERQH